MGKYCSKCGNELSDHAKFCNKCGSEYKKIRQETKKCSKCGNDLKEGMKFCPKCGTLMTDFEKVNQNEKRNIEKAVDMVSEGISQAGTTIAEGLEKGKERFGEFQKMSAEEKKEKAGQYVDVAKEKSKEFIGDARQYKTLPKAKKKKIILTVCTALVILLLVNSLIGGGVGTEYTVSEFLQRYNELTQTEFVETEMDVWEEISLEDMEPVGTEPSQFKDVENITAYAYAYQGVVSSPGVIFVYADERDIVVGASFVMNTEYIAGNDDFHNIVLDSLIKSFDSTLSEDEVYEIKSHFSMQDHLIGAVTRSDYGAYEYNDKIYGVGVSEANGLTFSVYSKDEIK